MGTIDQLNNAQSRQNIQNNANTIKSSANIASRSANPYAKGIGTAVKAADKLSGGKASERIGKRLNTANKLSPLGGIKQAGLNKVANSGTVSRIKSATGKKSNFLGGFFSNKQETKSTETNNNVSDDSTDAFSNEHENQGQGGNSVPSIGSFVIKLKYVVIALIVGAPILGALIIVCLLMSASMVKLELLGIGSADVSVELEEQEIQDSFEKHEEDTDLEVGLYIREYPKQSNLKFIAKEKKKNEADLDELADYYPAINSYKDQYDENMLYNFFYKIHLISRTYKQKYQVNVDVPLLMATLMMQAPDKDDINIVFDSNISSEDNFYEKKTTNEEQNLDRFSYDYDWSSYSTSKKNSDHDIEVLVQNMFSKQVKETCVDSSGEVTQENILKDTQLEEKTLTCEEGEEYKTQDLGMERDDEKYKEFLRQFLYEKYIFSDGSYYVTGSGTLSFDQSYSKGTASTNSIFVHSSEPDPSMAINYWSYIDSKNFVYPKDEKTGKSLGAWPKDYKDIPAQLNNTKTYQDTFIWPVTPTGGTYSSVYEHNGIDIMANFGTPIYSPADGILVYSTWGHTINKGSDETAYSVTIELENPVEFAGVNISLLFLTHMSGIRYRCEWGECNRKVKKGELLGFVGNAAGSAEGAGWAPHLHMTYYPQGNYDGGIYTTNMEKLYNIKSGTKRNAGE